MTKQQPTLCPCGKQEADTCCVTYISGKRIPDTPEALMRSRYTAYTQADIEYIQATMREQAAENFDPVSAETWAKTARWKRLKIIRAFEGLTDDTAHVEFIATYIWDGKPQKLTEISEFKRIQGRWYYVRGEQRSIS